MSAPRPRAALFLNPAAARGRHEPRAAVALLANHFELTVHAPPSADAMGAAARRAAGEGCGLLIAGGGDGTINLLVAALAGTDAVLGILPLGTANDLARQFRLPRNPEAAARRIITGTRQRCDLITVNGRRFCTVGGLGLVTDCALSANRLKSAGHPLRAFARALGAAIYPGIAVGKILFGGRCAWDLTLEWSGPAGEKAVSRRARVHALFLANQRGVGGDLTLPTDARNDDGLLDLCVLEAGPRLRLLRTVLALRLDRPIRREVIGVHRAARVRIACDHELGFLGDGELLGHGKQFELEVIPGGLTVIA